MAEIPVEKKSSLGWLWWLLAALLLALLLWWLFADGDDDAIEATPAVVEETTENVVAEDVADAAAVPVTLAAIVADPAAFYGKKFAGEVTVPGPLTDRGFWIENDGTKMFAIVIDEPVDYKIDINAGQTLSITDGEVRDASDIANLEGKPLDDDTKAILADQKAFILVDEDNVVIKTAS